MIDAPAATFPLEDLYNSTAGFVAIFTFVMGAVGLFSGYMTVAVLTAYVPFVYLVTTANGLPFLTNFVYVSLAVVMIGIGFKVVRAEGWA